MTKYVSAIALFAAAGAAQAAFFEVRAVDASSLGSPIVASTAFYQNGLGGNFGPSEDAMEIQGNPNQLAQFDSYVAIDTGPSHPGTIGVKGDGFQANPGDIASIGAVFVGSNNVQAVWFMDPEGARPNVGSVTNALFGGADALFLGRFSFRSTTATAPSGQLTLGENGLVVELRDPGTLVAGSPETDSLLVKFNSFNSPVSQGLDGGSLTTHPTAYDYELRVVVTEVGPFGGGAARWQLHDLYIVQIPTPGATALLGLAGLMVARRRRA